MAELLAVFLCSYLVGSIPVGFLIARLKAGVDVRTAGSGRSGGFNVYAVTRSRAAGVLVGLLDAVKGFVPVFAVSMMFPGSTTHAEFSLLGAIVGHVYPVWTRFRGGRGLATAAGGMFLLGFSYTIVWGAIWLATKVALKREILVANLSSIMMTPFVLWMIPWSWVKKLVVLHAGEGSFVFFSCVLSLVLMLSHYDAAREVWKGNSTEDSTTIPPLH